LDNPTIVSPDLGGMKRAERYATALGYNIAFINKKRLKANEVDKMTLIGSVKDSDIIIVDDMIDTGGTIIKALDLLRNDGAIRSFVFACHGVYSNDAVSKFGTNEHRPMVFCTNTLPLVNPNGMVNVHQLDVIQEFNNALRKILN
jgi:ribose-phosphate pyrophosphokinase